MHREDKVKRSVVHGDTASELVKSIQVVDWDKVAEEVRPRTGGKTDFGVQFWQTEFDTISNA